MYNIQKQGNSSSINPLKTQLILLILHWRWLSCSVAVQNSLNDKKIPTSGLYPCRTIAAGAVTGSMTEKRGTPKRSFFRISCRSLHISLNLSGASFRDCLYSDWIHSTVGAVQTQSSMQYLPQRVYTLVFRNLNKFKGSLSQLDCCENNVGHHSFLITETEMYHVFALKLVSTSII